MVRSTREDGMAGTPCLIVGLQSGLPTPFGGHRETPSASGGIEPRTGRVCRATIAAVTASLCPARANLPTWSPRIVTSSSSATS